MLEETVKAAVKKTLNELKAYYFMPVQMGYGATSLDFLVCHRGRFFAIECKRPGISTMSERQKFVSEQIERAGGAVILINDPAQIGVLRTILEAVE